MNRQELADAFRKLGLTQGDKVLFHSSLVSLGQVEGGPATVIDAFLDVIGPQGTLLAPVFGKLGILTQTLKERPGAIVSPCPVGTLAAIGADAEAICHDHWKAQTAHGEDTPFTRLADMGGYVCLIGVDQDRNTSLHGIEALLKLPYLKDTTATFTTPEGETVTKTWKYYPGPHRDFIGLDKAFRESGAERLMRIGNAQVRLIKSAEMFRVGLELGKKDPGFALCDNSACEDCVRQRAAIYADRMAHESFKLTASSRLAGRYVPEMVENLQAAGVSCIELDYVQGKACAFMSAEKLKAVVNELSAGGIQVSALRAEVVPDDHAALVTLAKEAGIGRVILPLGENEAAETAVTAGLEVAFANTNQTGARASQVLTGFRAGHPATFCFNPPAFVKAGEYPFLKSWRAGRFIKTIGQLDLCDALWDGTPTRFACGNGTFKEMVSILRCSNFSGWFCLGGGAFYPGSLREAAKD
ncbi:MAG: AAC(3) family N-acetyltransferase, partial [Victivallales bacterium]|nr:AAC(3) family N-acetyltransferase [Victivallales bacterium]